MNAWQQADEKKLTAEPKNQKSKSTQKNKVNVEVRQEICPQVYKLV
jgi:hypothetical protein